MGRKRRRSHRYNPKSRNNLVQYRQAQITDIAPMFETPDTPSAMMKNQDLARDIVNMAAPEAAAYLVSVVQGQGSARRAPVKTRVDAAVRLLDMAGLRSGGGAPETTVDDLNADGLRAFLAAGARALELQRAAREAQDAVTVPVDLEVGP